MKGWRCPNTGLWRVPIKPDFPNININTDTALLSKEATNIIENKRGCFDPEEFANSVILHALATANGKSSEKTLPRSTGNCKRPHATSKIWSQINQSTSRKSEEIQRAEAELQQLRQKHRDIYVQVKEATEMVHTDQTGRFSVTSSRGHRYIMVLINIDSNYIAMEPMKSRKTAELIQAYSVIMDKLKSKGIIPKKQILDNEAPQLYKEKIEEYGLKWELVPPTNHRRLIAERAIQTAKGHVIANLMGCDETYPAREWHRLLPQMEMILNMLRPSNLRPTVSAYAYVFGNHDYNRVPFTPLGCKTQCFVGPDNRTSYGEHSIDS
ncbi:hypothetical protein ACHAXN_000105, partial [Cyclotella atomus]